MEPMCLITIESGNMNFNKDRIILKKCTGKNGCGELFPANGDYFSKHRDTIDGFFGICKKCVSKYNRIYRSENTNDIKEYCLEYRLKYGHILNENDKRRHYLDRELCLDKYGHRCNQPGCEITESEFLAFDHIYNDGAEHREIIGMSGIVRWLIKNDFPDSIQLLCHNHNSLKEKSIARSNLSQNMNAMCARKCDDKIRLEVFTYYGLKCACCREDNFDVLEIDHIFGDGSRHRRDTNCGTGVKFYRWLIRNQFPKEFRTLCSNCNKSLGFYKHCPHQSKTTYKGVT